MNKLIHSLSYKDEDSQVKHFGIWTLKCKGQLLSVMEEGSMGSKFPNSL